MMYRNVSKKNILLKFFVLTLFFVSMNSVFSRTIFEAVATSTSINDKKKPKRLIPRKSAYIPEFKEVNISSKLRESWDGTVDRIEKELEALIKLERELESLPKFGISLAYKAKQKLVEESSRRYDRLLESTKSRFNLHVRNKILQKRKQRKKAKAKFYEISAKIDPGYPGNLKLAMLKKYAEIPEFKKIDDEYKEQWDNIVGKIQKNVKEFHRLRGGLSRFGSRASAEYAEAGDEMISKIDQYHSLFKDSQDLFLKIYKKILLKRGFVKVAIEQGGILKAFDNIPEFKVIDSASSYKLQWSGYRKAMKSWLWELKNNAAIVHGYLCAEEERVRITSKYNKERQKAEDLFKKILE